MALTPFSSLDELRATYISVGTFRKTPYRKELANARIRSPLMLVIILIPAGIVWLMFSPCVLLLQVAPRVEPYVASGVSE